LRAGEAQAATIAAGGGSGPPPGGGTSGAAVVMPPSPPRMPGVGAVYYSISDGVDAMRTRAAGGDAPSSDPLYNWFVSSSGGATGHAAGGPSGRPGGPSGPGPGLAPGGPSGPRPDPPFSENPYEPPWRDDPLYAMPLARTMMDRNAPKEAEIITLDKLPEPARFRAWNQPLRLEVQAASGNPRAHQWISQV